MKRLLFIFVSLILFSCATDTGKNRVDSALVKKDSVADSMPLMMATTALEVLPAALPPAFALDTLSVIDTSKHLSAFFHFPVSSDEKLNAMIVKLVKENTKGYEDYHPGEFDQVSIEAWVSSFSVTRSIVSMCFTDQSFTSGAAHFNHGYTCLNYDMIKQKQIFLADIFNLRTEKEKQSFCDSILSPEINNDFRITLDDLKKDADFIIDKGNLIFYFDDFEKGPSMCTYVVPLQSIRKFVKKDYQWLIG